MNADLLLISSNRLGACHRFALSLNLFPKGGRKTLTVLRPFAHDCWEKRVGDEGNAGFATMTGSQSFDPAVR